MTIMFKTNGLLSPRQIIWLAFGAALFAASSIVQPTPAYSKPALSKAAEAMLLRCRAKNLSVERCREIYAKVKMRAKQDFTRSLLAKCRLSGHTRKRCDRLVSTAMTSPRSRAVNKVKAYCLRNNLKSPQCQALINNRLGGGGDKTTRLLARCKSVGLSELECKKRVDAGARLLK